MVNAGTYGVPGFFSRFFSGVNVGNQSSVISKGSLNFLKRRFRFLYGTSPYTVIYQFITTPYKLQYYMSFMIIVYGYIKKEDCHCHCHCH